MEDTDIHENIETFLTHLETMTELSLESESETIVPSFPSKSKSTIFENSSLSKSDRKKKEIRTQLKTILQDLLLSELKNVFSIES
jgi:hypothetical protein